MPDTADNGSDFLGAYSNNKPNKSEQLKLNNEYSPLDLIGKKFQMGSEGVANSRNNAYAMFRTDLSDEEEMNMINQGAAKVGPGFSQSAYEAQPWYLRAVDDAAQTLPGIGDSIVQGGVGGSLAVGANAATLGAVATGIGRINPAAGAAAGGIGTAAVFEGGYTAGSVKSIWEQSAGDLYGDLRKSGVKRNTAKTLAFTFGSLNAGLEYIGLHTLQGVAGKFMSAAQKKTIQKSLAHPFVKRIENNMLARLGMKLTEEVATETTTEGAQQTSTELAKVVAGMVQKGKADSFTNWDSAKTNIKDSMLQALGASAILGLGAAGGGHAVGVVTGAVGSKIQKIQADILNQLEGKTPQELLQLMNEGLKQMPNGETTPEQQDASVHYDEQGNPYIKAAVTETDTIPQTTMNEMNRPIDAGKAWTDKIGQTSLADIVNDPQSVIDKGLQAIYPQDTPVEADQVDSGQMRLPLVEWRSLNPTEVQARQDQIHADIFTLQKEETRLQDQILIAEKSGQSSHKMIDKWRKVTENIEHLKSESETLDAGFHAPEASPNSLNTARTDLQGNRFGRIRMKKLNKIFDKLTKTADKLEQIQSQVTAAHEVGFNAGAYKTRRSIAKLQADLKNIVNVATDDPNIRAQVRQYIAGVTTPEQAQKAIKAIKENVFKLESQNFEKGQLQARAKVFDAVKQAISTRVTKTATQSGYPVNKLPQELVEKLATLRTFMQNEKGLKQYEEEFATQYGHLDVSELPVDVADKLQLAGMVRRLYDGDQLSVNVTAANISQWIYDGKKLIEEKKAALQLQKETDINDAAQSLGVFEKKDTNWVKLASQRRNHFINDVQAPWLTWNTLLDKMSPKDQEHKITKQLDDTVERNMFIAHVELATTNLVRSIAKNMSEAGLKTNLMQKIANDNNTDLSIRFRNRGGSFTTQTMSKAQLLDFVMKFRDTSLHPALTDDKTGNGFTLPGEVPAGESTLEVLQSQVTVEDQVFMDAVMEFYQDYHASINKVYKAKYGIDLPMRWNYTPVVRGGYKVDAPYSQEGLQIFSLLPGSAKTREESLLKIVPRSPLEAAQAHISQWEYFRAYDTKLTQINNVLTDPAIRQHIKDEYGSGTMGVMDNYVERFIKNDPIPGDPSDSLWNSLRADFTRSVLAGKHVTGFLTQMSSGTTMWANYNPIDILHGVSQTILHPIETEKAIRSSATLKERYKSGASQELQSALKQQGLWGTTIHKLLGIKPETMDVKKHELLNKFMFAGYSAGDAGVARVFGGAVYHAEIKNGSTPAQALTTVERLMDQTQQSTAVSQTPQVLTNPIVNTLIAPFAQQPVQVMGRAMIHIQDFVNKPTPANWMRLGHQIAMNWAVPGFFIGLAKAAPSWLAPTDDDEDRQRQAMYDVLGNTVMGPINGLPKIGDVAQAIWFALAKPLIGVDESKRTDYIGKDPFIGYVLNDLYGSFKQWSKMNKEVDPLALPSLGDENEANKELKANSTYVKAIAKTVGLPEQLGAIPLELADRLGEGDTVGAAMSLGGWTPGALKERQSKNSDLFGSKGLDLKENSNAYDTMKTYLDTYLAKQKPAKTADTNKEFIDTLVKESQKP